VKNKLTDLNNHLFAQLERLGDEDLSGDALEAEISRTKAITAVAGQIISGGSLMLSAVKLSTEYSDAGKKMPLLLED